jgi:hypothetical protein
MSYSLTEVGWVKCGSPFGMFLQRRNYPEAYPLNHLRLSFNTRMGEDVITGLSSFHALPQAEPT